MQYIKLIAIAFCCLAANTHIAAQDIDAPAARRQATTAQWERAKEGIDFNHLKKDKPKTPPTAAPYIPQPSEGLLSGLSIGAKMLMYGIIIALVVGLLYYFVQRGLFLRNANVPQGNDFSLADIEDHLHETDLDRFLRTAVQSGNYRLAIRIYYLDILKACSLREHINFKKDKTNAQYTAEIGTNAPLLHTDFRHVTRLFERVWYTDFPITANDYDSLEPAFRLLLARI